MSYRVIAECVDARTGARFLPGDMFEPQPQPEQAERLIRAGAIVQEAKEELTPARAPRTPLKVAKPK